MMRKEALSQYKAKRDFARTAEPEGKAESSPDGNIFIVQKHDATRLHWDFRLEVDGVLKSWAVTKGPSADPDDKRLAVRTEDHPLSYAEFEGTIPKGEYGGGTVMLWDRGTWEPVPGKSAADIDKGHLHFTLRGERMKGEWLLVRMRGKPGEKRENWLLRKIEDVHSGASSDLVERQLTSVLSGRSMAEITADKTASHSQRSRKGNDFTATMKAAAKQNTKVAKPRRKALNPRLPDFEPLQLATLVDEVPAGNAWMHEIKFDGYRALVSAVGDKLRIFTRNGLDWTDKFAPLVDHFKALDLPSCLIDGEIVAYDKDGNPDFSALQQILKRGHGSQSKTDALSFHAFDLLQLAGEDLKPLPNLERKERLEALLIGARGPIHVADHVIGAGEKLFGAMCKAGQEGIIAKRIDASYNGRRSQNWLKVKCIMRQEFVILGWTASKARGRPFASLLLGQYEDGTLAYKGKVGTGFDAADFDDLAPRMVKIASEKPAAEVPREEARSAHWLHPELVAEVAFAEFTAERRVRHGSFVALRSDKPAKAVTPEVPRHAPGPEADLVKISSRDRIIFPESGQTKGDLADYYAAVGPIMLPFLAGRPLSLVRCPQGRARQCFFQKHDAGTFGPQVRHVPIIEKDGGAEDYLYLVDVAGVLACVQMGTIEFHGWTAKVADVEQPDRMIIDLDPDEGLSFAEVKRAAQDIRERLADLGLVSFAMLTGGKGIHVVVPLTPGHDWESHKDFARRFAEALSLAEPERYVATMSKAKRKGRIFIDWMRNQRGSTAILPYSARARAGAPVAAPIAWDELESCELAGAYAIGDWKKLINRAESAALKGWGFAAQPLPAF